MMSTRRTTLGHWLQSGSEHVAVALMAIMFVSFLLQICFRYLLNQPLGWSEEVTILCWIWVVLWGASFIVPDAEEVRFDIIYGAVSPATRRYFTLVTSTALVVLLVISLPASWRYVAFMKREHSAYLHMRFNYLYSIYLIFAVTCIVKHAWLAWSALRGTAVSGPERVGEAAKP